jgi:transcriptional regulator with XRE-family HTH domain
MSDTTVAFTVGDVIRKLRKDRHWSIRKLQHESGIGRMTISAIERNESNYQKDTLDALALAFKMKSGAELEALASLSPSRTRRATDSDLAPEWIAFTRRVMRLNRQAQGALHVIVLAFEDAGAVSPHDAPEADDPAAPAPAHPHPPAHQG